MSFSILSLNLWNISEPLEPRYRALAAGLARLRPDIVCLQEVYRVPGTGHSQGELIAEMAKLTCRSEEGGLAILCREPLIRSRSAALPQFADDPSRFVLLAEFQIEHRPLLVINTHLAYRPEMIEEREQQARAVMAAIRQHYPERRDIAKIMCGDFNDVADSPAVRTVLSAAAGFRDAFAECRPSEPGFTYSPRNPYVERSWTIDERIDYVFVSPHLKPKYCTTVFDGDGGLDFVSDHFGVYCSLEFC